MPRVKVADVVSAAKAHPREFAILAELAAHKDDYVVDGKALTECATKLGNPESVASAASADEIDFGLFTNIFHKPGKAVEGEGNCLGWAAHDMTGVLSPFKFQRRELRPDDIAIKITHAGICHSDLHQIRGEWGNSMYPMVPGHEIVGVVVEVGAEAKGFKVGDRAGVGCFVDACFNCSYCARDLEQHCKEGMMSTYNAKDKEGAIVFGGYSTHIVVRAKCALRVPTSLPLAGAAPLLCAGITVFSPLKYYGLNKAGTRLGVMGLGGLGHMAVKLGVAMGCDVTVISRSTAKEAEARALGAQHFLVSSDEKAMKACANSFDGIVDTVSAEHDMQPLADLLDVGGKIVVVGAPPVRSMSVAPMSLLMKKAMIGGSLIGGLAETQEMLDFCGEKGVVADVEVIAMADVNKAMDRLAQGDVKFRFVIDVQASLLL